MASGVWTWSRFWTALPFAFATVRASMKASKEANAGVMHQSLIAYLDPNDTNVTKVEELEVELEVRLGRPVKEVQPRSPPRLQTVYPNSCFLMLDYSRPARATYI
ncbi:hypothetical protein BJY59DRAFT_144991 [Rhodotorula toruloides]